MRNLSHSKLRYLFLLLSLYLVTSIIFPASENYGTTNEYGFKRLIPQIISVLILAYSLFELKGLVDFKNKAVKSFYYFALYTFISYVIFALLKSNFTLYFFAEELKILFWIIPAYFFYILFINVGRDFSLKYLRLFVFIYLSYVIIGSFQEYSFRASEKLEIMTEEQGVYLGGNIVFLVPLIFIAFKGRLKSYLFLLAFGIAILTAKRTPILMISVFGIFQFKSIFTTLKKIDYILLTVLSLVGFSFLLSSYWDMLLVRNTNDIERGGSYGSGREIFYQIVMNDFLNGDVLQMFFGHGFGSVQDLLLKKYGMAISTHNGFLDCVYVYGLFGLTIYLNIFYRLIQNISYVAKYTNYKSIYIGFIIMWITQNLIVHGYSSPNMIAYSIFLAYIFSEAAKKRNEKKLKKYI